MAARLDWRDWERLPEHLLDSVLHRLVSPVDYVRFSGVCKRWLSVARHNVDKWRLPKFMLLIPTEDNSHESRSLFNIAASKIYDLRLPVPYSGRCSGSSHGWLITLEATTSVTLINPFSNQIVRLPSIVSTYIDGRFDDILEKAILSADPCLHPDDYEVVAIFGDHRELFIFKSGDNSWNTVHLDGGPARGVVDVIYYKGQVYFLSAHDEVLSVVNGSDEPGIFCPKARTVMKSTSSWDGHMQAYIVESTGGDLLLVKRYMFKIQLQIEGTSEEDLDYRYITSEFEVCKLGLDQNSSQPKWVEMKSLGEEALFLGDNYSTAVLASEFPGCWPNSIYFTDDYLEFGPPANFGSCDMGVFSLENGNITAPYTLNPTQKCMPPSVWIEPRFSENWLKLPSF